VNVAIRKALIHIFIEEESEVIYVNESLANQKADKQPVGNMIASL
jgi:hypothetical protein